MPAWTRNSNIYIIFRCQQKLSHRLVVRVIGQLLWWASSKTVLPTPGLYTSKHLSTSQGHLRQVTFHPIEKRLSPWLSLRQGSWIWLSGWHRLWSYVIDYVDIVPSLQNPLTDVRIHRSIIQANPSLHAIWCHDECLFGFTGGCYCRALLSWKRYSAFDFGGYIWCTYQAGDPWDIRVYDCLMVVVVKCGYNDAREISSLQLVSFIGQSFLIGAIVAALFFNPSSLCGYRLSSTWINTLNVLSTTQYICLCYFVKIRFICYNTTCDASNDTNQERRLKAAATDGAIYSFAVGITEWWGCWQNLGVVILVAHHYTKYPRRLYY